MNAALGTLLAHYTLSTSDDYLRALREVLQRVSLLGLWRSRFFDKAAFYGGTALRIFHGLPRYSEDMDFSLVEPEPDFSLAKYAQGLTSELRAFGLEASVERRSKPIDRKVESAFLKTNTLQSMLLIDAPARITDRLHRDARLKIKLEVDIAPPPQAGYEVRSLLLPIPFQVQLYDPPSLFAGKMHALLCRSWKSRIKGRDFYDFVWFVGRKTPCSLRHLRERMVQSGNLGAHEPLDRTSLVDMLHARFGSVDLTEAAHDVAQFVTDKQSLELWSTEFFNAVAEQMLTV